MPYLNSNNVIIRNSNAMDTVKLIDMLSKLGVIKKKKRRATKKTQQPQPEIQETPAQSAQRFLTSRPVISLQQNPDTAKMVDIERIRREAFGHIGRLTDTVERQRDEMDEQRRMVAMPRIRRSQEPTEEEIIDESVDVEGIDEGSAIPSVNEAEMDRHGANDATEEKSNDRLVGYAGEDDEGFVANSDDDNGFVDPGEPEMGDESVVTNTADEQQDWLDNASQEDEQLPPDESTRNIFDEPEEQLPSAQAQEPEPEPRLRAGRGASKYDTKAISTALTSLGLTEIAKNKAEINNLKMFQVSQIFDILKENGITRSGYEGMNAKDRKDLLAEELSKYGEMLLRKKND
jgi:hypothetical protein